MKEHNTLTLTREEAIVLDDWLARLQARPTALTADEAERKVLANIACQLEAQLAELFRPDYVVILAAAKKAVVGEDQEVLDGDLR